MGSWHSALSAKDPESNSGGRIFFHRSIHKNESGKMFSKPLKKTLKKPFEIFSNSKNKKIVKSIC